MKEKGQDEQEKHTREKEITWQTNKNFQFKKHKIRIKILRPKIRTGCYENGAIRKWERLYCD